MLRKPLKKVKKKNGRGIIISQLAISETNGSSTRNFAPVTATTAAPRQAVQFSQIMRKKLAHLGPPRAMVLADHNCLRAIFCSLIHELELELKSEKKNCRLLQLMNSVYHSGLKNSINKYFTDLGYTEGSRLMLLLGPGKSRIIQKSH